MSCEASTVLERIDQLAGITAYPWTLTRRVFTPEYAQAEAFVLGWMEKAGLATRRDPVGSLIGRIEGTVPGGPAIVIGGRVDTVENACRFDGVLGVLMGIACVERLVCEGTRFRQAVEVVAFVDDAARRFGLPNLGSRAAVDRWKPGDLDWTDTYDVTLRQAMQANGLDPERFEGARRNPSAVAVYLEVFAEPGPVLERAASPIGIVEALTATSMLRVTLSGAVGAAASFPMSGRRDALAGAAECVIEVERVGSSRGGITATVVRFEAEAVPSFVVHGSTQFGVLIGSTDDAARRAATTEAASSFRRIASRRGLEILVEEGLEPDGLRCAPAIVRSLMLAAEASGRNATTMGTNSSNAFHMASLGPIGILLIRAQGGTGWGPGAEVSAADIAAGLDVLSRAIVDLAGDGASAIDET